jgi:hypothetical protein
LDKIGCLRSNASYGEFLIPFLLPNILSGHFNYKTQKTGMKARELLVSQIERKCRALNSSTICLVTLLYCMNMLDIPMKIAANGLYVTPLIRASPTAALYFGAVYVAGTAL